ncbi:hypothetical protein [Nocardia sp. CC227C]|uniref:hypothetical protein n=1 Tax=Nocardia sp. CC227C TaxID=3044562 RepID=UPI00278C75A7|nr:hypothetical protein [Nocardia sp. CC227C]
MSWIVIILKPVGVGGGTVLAACAVALPILLLIFLGVGTSAVWSTIAMLVLAAVILFVQAMSLYTSRSKSTPTAAGSREHYGFGKILSEASAVVGAAVAVAIGIVILWGIIWFIAEFIQLLVDGSKPGNNECERIGFC